MRLRALAVPALIAALTACGPGGLSVSPKGSNSSSGSGSSSSASPSPTATHPSTANIHVHGDTSSKTDQLAVQAIASVESYWSGQYPTLYGGTFKPVSGGFYAVDPSQNLSVPCVESADDIEGNAFYCPKADVVAWDSKTLLPRLDKKFGDFSVAVVFAHELGHTVQSRANLQQTSIVRELQADCFAGSWAASVRKSGEYQVDDTTLDKAMSALLTLRDEPGTTSSGSQSHGSGFDRVNAFQTGLDQGAGECKTFRTGHPVVTEIPFSTRTDEASGGDMPYASLVANVPADIEEYWEEVYPKIAQGKAWKKITDFKPYDTSNAPTCDGSSLSGMIAAYCSDGNFVAWENSTSMPAIWRDYGDFAATTVLARQFGDAVLDNLNDPTSGKTRSLRADCFAGAYAASVVKHDRPASDFTASPGDLDEAVAVLLDGGSKPDRTGTGSERVRAYRAGVFDGALACTR